MVLPMSVEVRASLVLVAFAALHMRRRFTIADYNDFKSLTDTVARQRFFRSRLWKSALMLGVASLFGLLVVGRLDALWTMPPEFAGVPASTSRYFEPAFLPVLITLVGLAISGRPRGGGRRKARYVCDIEALLPWNNAERFWAVLLSLDAGVSEELFFRLLVPLLLVIITKQAGFAFVATCVLFGLGHAYQGRAGIVGATVAGLLLTLVYIASGSIWWAVAWHAAIDLNALILRPLLEAGLRRVVSEVVRWLQ